MVKKLIDNTSDKTNNPLVAGKYLTMLLTIAILFVVSPGCEYDYTEPLEIIITDEVSFSEDIQPIFTVFCNTGAGCHSGTSYASSLVDLSEGVAYGELMTSGDKAPYIDTTAPESGLLYTKINIGGTMEQYTTPTDRAIILKWIEQGALNN